MSISRTRPLHHSSISRIKASPESPLRAGHPSTQPHKGSKACGPQPRTAQGESLRDTHTLYPALMDPSWQMLTDVVLCCRPGSYSHHALTNRKVSWPTCFGRPDWSRLPQLEKKSYRVKVGEGSPISWYTYNPLMFLLCNIKQSGSGTQVIHVQTLMCNNDTEVFWRYKCKSLIVDEWHISNVYFSITVAEDRMIMWLWSFQWKLSFSNSTSICWMNFSCVLFSKATCNTLVFSPLAKQWKGIPETQEQSGLPESVLLTLKLVDENSAWQRHRKNIICRTQSQKSCISKSLKKKRKKLIFLYLQNEHVAVFCILHYDVYKKWVLSGKKDS